MARGRSDQTIVVSPKFKQEDHSSIKRDKLTEESPGPKRAEKPSRKLIHHNRNNGGEQPGQKIPERAVKFEEALSFPAELGNETRGAKISVNDGQRCHKREGIRSLQTLENGLIYFFYRSRVDISGARGIRDVARSFIVLRPAPPDAISGQSNRSLEFGTNFRLLVVPKKVLPTSERIREMGFIEKAGITLKELQETFMAGGEYETQTHGVRTIPEATLYAKGVYAITSTQQSSYLSYILTNPQTLGPVQEDFGLRVRGSWLVQSKNPKRSSPSSVSLSKGPEYPESFGDIFGHYRWVPLQPKLIEYPNAQFLFIGRSNREVSSIVPEGRQEDRMKADQELEEISHQNDEKEKQFRGFQRVYGDSGLQVLHFSKISTVWAR